MDPRDWSHCRLYPWRLARQDVYTYYPSPDPFADFTSTCKAKQSARIASSQTLTAVGYFLRRSGIHNVKIGAMFEHTLITEDDRLGIVDPGFIASLSGANGNPCVNADGVPIAPPCTDLAPFDLTAGGSFFNFHGHADVKEFALYGEDAITKGSWTFNLGLRGDFYNGLTTARQAEPRLGIAYNIKPTNTVLRISLRAYFETPFNENLVLFQPRGAPHPC